MNITKRIVVSGRVQGVFFRENTRVIATDLQLTGGVRNLRDGRLEILVCGLDESVQILIKWLKIGPKHAKVTTIEISDYAFSIAQNCLNGQFEIWPTQ